MQIERYNDKYKEQFKDAFVDYFVTDFGAPFDTEVIRGQICQSFLDLDQSDIAPILVATHEDQLVGFLSFQIDSEKSNWNERPGWGFLRELYVRRDLRRCGVGTALGQVALDVLAKSGATQCYLTTDSAFEFWESVGFTRTGEMAPNGSEMLERQLA